MSKKAEATPSSNDFPVGEDGVSWWICVTIACIVGIVIGLASSWSYFAGIQLEVSNTLQSRIIQAEKNEQLCNGRVQKLQATFRVKEFPSKWCVLKSKTKL